MRFILILPDSLFFLHAESSAPADKHRLLMESKDAGLDGCILQRTPVCFTQGKGQKEGTAELVLYLRQGATWVRSDRR